MFAKVQDRAGHSESERRYLACFEDRLTKIRRKGEETILGRRPAWDDPVGLAAEIEALTAYRTLTEWDRRH